MNEISVRTTRISELEKQIEVRFLSVLVRLGMKLQEQRKIKILAVQIRCSCQEFIKEALSAFYL